MRKRIVYRDHLTLEQAMAQSPEAVIDHRKRVDAEHGEGTYDMAVIKAKLDGVRYIYQEDALADRAGIISIHPNAWMLGEPLYTTRFSIWIDYIVKNITHTV